MTVQNATQNHEYSVYYLKKYNIWYRKYFPVDVPFKFIARAMCRGKILDVGCGPGRYLSFLGNRITGVDYNWDFVYYARNKRYRVFHTSEFFGRRMEYFDTLLFAHILEHMSMEDGIDLINNYLPYLKFNGRIIIIVPHGYCYKNDPTHVLYYDRNKIEELAFKLNFKNGKTFYHPFPDWMSSFLVTDGIYILSK